MHLDERGYEVEAWKQAENGLPEEQDSMTTPATTHQLLKRIETEDGSPLNEL